MWSLRPVPAESEKEIVKKDSTSPGPMNTDSPTDTLPVSPTSPWHTQWSVGGVCELTIPEKSHCSYKTERVWLEMTKSNATTKTEKMKAEETEERKGLQVVTATLKQTLSFLSHSSIIMTSSVSGCVLLTDSWRAPQQQSPGYITHSEPKVWHCSCNDTLKSGMGCLLAGKS